MFVNTPLLARVILIFITLLIRVFLSLVSSKWVSFLLMLLFLGGIIVLFVYICTLITKIKVIVRNKRKIYFVLLLLSIQGALIRFFKKTEFGSLFSGVEFSLMYQKSLSILIVYRIMYLLAILYVSVKLIQKHKGGLKSKFND